MTRLRTTGMALAGAAAMFALTAAPAHAAPGDVTTSCASVVTPTGYVDVSWGYSASCGTQSFNPNIKQIKQLTGLPVGTVVQACGSTYQPAGWIQTASYYSSSCVYAANGGFNNNAWTLKRVS
ncbi:hypothetical protein ACFZBM_22020 [Streptomyces lavendulae]|uniref:Uncharacterized protein n=1 Tax=Streptomyces lavendulae subsp. lavendulae TaxID=58340 RepID=A0A2K8PRW6_STRLA|nr:hypothetical protein [Streptomyces lavendulae]ATZ28840.1 hypothetical protein SLAV_35350 [Streptomyces lavendulae subsp. lavendulae]QUQ58665.1 hypothetical protein SLLC_33525 [Streptomyces lavendulae subsp. lavendulae]GLV84432.1 hypothetical protein Slala03_41210 [Streptomyces lavendulae subsp. lavendulae]GLX38913.1 hypothetical protein Sros01_49860 [Streptomyces roseochromogenus]